MKYLIAIIFIFSAICSSGQNKDKYDQLYDSLQKAGQSEKLIPYFLKELKLKPKNENVLRWLGYLYISDNQPEIGEKYYRDALAINPKCARCYLNIGKAYANKKDTKKAMELFDKAISLDPNDATLYMARGMLKEFMQTKYGGLEDFEKAIEKDPKNADYYIQRAEYYAARKFPLLAMADMDKAIELAPLNYYPRFKRANLNYDNQKFDEAMADVNAAIRLDSTQYELYIGRGAIYTVMEEYNKAVADYTKAIALNPKDFSSYYSRSLAKYALEDMDGSCADILACYALLKKNEPTNPLKEELEYSITTYCDSTKVSYYYQRGIAFYNLKQFDKAVNIYTAGIKKFPDNSMALSFRGNAYFMLKDYAHALPDYYASISNKANVIQDFRLNQKHTLLSNDSMNIYVNNFLASMYVSIAEAKFAMGQYAEALAEVNKAIDLATDMKGFEKEHYYNVRGNIFMGLGKYQDALTDFDKCIKMKPSFALAYVNRAIAKFNLDDQVKITSYYIQGGINSQQFNANWKFPLKTTVKKSSLNITSALADCNRAISIDPNLDFGYYVRAHIKRSLNQLDFCLDFLKANGMGYPVEPELLKECGK